MDFAAACRKLQRLSGPRKDFLACGIPKGHFVRSRRRGEGGGGLASWTALVSGASRASQLREAPQDSGTWTTCWVFEMHSLASGGRTPRRREVERRHNKVPRHRAACGELERNVRADSVSLPYPRFFSLASPSVPPPSASLPPSSYSATSPSFLSLFCANSASSPLRPPLTSPVVCSLSLPIADTFPPPSA